MQTIHVVTNYGAQGDGDADDSDALAAAVAAGDSVILKSPDGTRYRVAVANGGALSTVAL